MNFFKKVSPLHSLITSCIIVLAYGFVYLLHNVEIIRDHFEDNAFDNILLGMSYISQDVDNAPNALVMMIDHEYLKQRGLIDENNESTYGYIFPRNELANLLQSIDAQSKKLNIKAVFLDYDLSYPQSETDEKISKNDQELLDFLSVPKPYKILLPVTGKHQFYLDLLKQYPWIVPVSVDFSNSKDGISRRYIAYEHGYPSASVYMYAMAQDESFELNTSRLRVGEKTFVQEDIIENRIILKHTDFYNGFYESAWNNLTIVSASMFDNLEFDTNAINKGTFLLMGSAYTHSNDIFNTVNSSMYGIQVHANAFMSHFYLDGALKVFPILYALLTVFVLSFIVNYGFDYLNSVSPTSSKKILFSFASVLVMSAVMYSISYYLLYVYKVWFNWNIPLVLFAISEMVDMLLKISTRYRYFKEKRKFIT